LPIDDWWPCLLNAYYHRFAFFDSRFAFGFKDTYVGAGGMSEFRVKDSEAGATKYLKKFFGSEIVVPKPRQSTITRRIMNRAQRTIRMPYRI